MASLVAGSAALGGIFLGGVSGWGPAGGLLGLVLTEGRAGLQDPDAQHQTERQGQRHEAAHHQDVSFLT